MMQYGWQGPGWYGRWVDGVWVGENLKLPPEGEVLSPIRPPKFTPGEIAYLKVSPTDFRVGFIQNRTLVGGNWKYTLKGNTPNKLQDEGQLSPIPSTGWEGPGWYSFASKVKTSYKEKPEARYFESEPAEHPVGFARIPTEPKTSALREDTVRIRESSTIYHLDECMYYQELEGWLRGIYSHNGARTFVKEEDVRIREDVWKRPGWYFMGRYSETSFVDDPDTLPGHVVTSPMFEIPGPKFTKGDLVSYTKDIPGEVPGPRVRGVISRGFRPSWVDGDLQGGRWEYLLEGGGSEEEGERETFWLEESGLRSFQDLLEERIQKEVGERIQKEVEERVKAILSTMLFPVLT